MLTNNSEELEELLKSNTTFNMNFQKLMKAFEKRIWTAETCYLFKVLLEKLFEDYKIPAIVHVKTNIDGDGKFEIEFLP